MLDVGELVAHLKLDDDKFNRGLTEGEARFKQFGHRMVSAAKLAGAAIAIGLVSQIPSAIESASHLAETQSKVNHLFGEGSAAVTEFANTAADQLGLSNQAALDAVATFGIFAKAAGLSGDAAGGFGRDMTQLAVDLASFHDSSSQQAIDAIGAALRGESEPIRAYGVLLDDMTLKSAALKLGLIATTKEALTPQQRVLAAQAAILDQTKDAQGDFARTSDGLAGQQKKLAARFENVKAALGEQLLPVATEFVGVLSDVLGYVKENQAWLVPLVASLGGLAAAIYLIVQAVKIWTTVQWLLNIAMTANPIGLVIAAIALLIAGIYLLWTNSAGFRNFFIGMWEHIWGFLKMIGAWFAGPFVDFFVGAWNFLTGLLAGYYTFLITTFLKVVGFITTLPGRIRDAAKNMWQGLVESFKAAINIIIRAWNALDFGLHVHLPSWLGGYGLDIDDVIPDIPYLAEGGMVPATPGGRLAVLAEGGQDEYALPENKLLALLAKAAAIGGGRSLTLHLDIGDGFRTWFRVDVRTAGGVDDYFATVGG
jgi:hypothetical protein